MSYYDRNASTNIDGTQTVWSTPEDEANEKAVVAAVEKAWNCQLHKFGKMAPIDWFATRRLGEVAALIELKARPHESTKYPTIWLNVRKWLALVLGSAGMQVPSLFVVKFADGIYWIPVAEIDATKHKIGGLRTIKKAISDIEPVIEIPIVQLRLLP